MSEISDVTARTPRRRGAKAKAIPASPEASVSAPGPMAPRQTKAELLRQMLLVPGGAPLQLLKAATGWQAHTIRAALSGLRKTGLTVTCHSGEDGPVYAAHVGTGTQARKGGATSSPAAGLDASLIADTTTPSVKA